ncbi:arf-GAP domain and FG repeat-containing protein 1 isoform X2 [Nylanderia fulva]|nr:arf-GAP domain and FG repeat-containing protein 1 isoform X2 [Nylanderia fulva]
MATFTQEEIDFIKEHGNDYCRRVWLGLMNMNPPLNLDTKDEQKMKDLMSAKYELKRYYLDPSLADQNTVQQKSTTNNSSNSSVIPRVPNASVGQKSINNAELRNNLNNSNNSNSSNNFSTDFVADFSKVPSDPFCSPTTNHFGQQPITSQPTFFANFDNNPIFNNSSNMETSAVFNQVGSTINGAHAPPSEDRYAALKDLDSLMKQTQLKEETAGMQSTWNANNTNASNATWSIGVGNHQHVISNPFAGGDLWRPSANIINNNNTQSVDNSLCNPANPFKPTQFPVNNDSQWIGIGASSNGDVLQLSQLMTPLWQPTVHANPFMVGMGVSNMTRNSKNPFL